MAGRHETRTDRIDSAFHSPRTLEYSLGLRPADLLKLCASIVAGDETDGVRRPPAIRSEISDESQHRAGLNQRQDQFRLDRRFIRQLPEVAVFGLHWNADRRDGGNFVGRESRRGKRARQEPVVLVVLVSEYALDQPKFH